jgi:hypothetical protein
MGTKVLVESGFTRGHIDAFSQRRLQAEQWRQEHGLPDISAAWQAAVLATRSPKQEGRLEDLRFEWQQRRSRLGLSGPASFGPAGEEVGQIRSGLRDGSGEPDESDRLRQLQVT